MVQIARKTLCLKMGLYILCWLRFFYRGLTQTPLIREPLAMSPMPRTPNHKLSHKFCSRTTLLWKSITFDSPILIFPNYFYTIVR